ncbi:hypothetical protein NYE27_21185 [Paenibacillus sp. FSL R10-2779]|uniref:hypothetical protein n=1 Tax=Paenibacillus sp. FSL R10-2779 TaxID=2975340 RepID=UPI0030F8C285
MQFLNAVAAYQAVGNREAIAQVVELMHDRSVSRAVLPEDDASVYVAIRALTVTNKARTEIDYEPGALTEYRYTVHQTLGIDIFGGVGFDEFRRNAAVIRRFLGFDDYEALVYALSRWLDYLDFEQAVIVPALEHAFSRVPLDMGDEEKKERKTIRYINRAFETEYIRLFVDWQGMVRLGRRDSDGQYRNIYVAPKKPEAWRIIFERPITPEEAARIGQGLTAYQQRIVRDSYEVVTADIEGGQLGEYKVSESGQYRIKVRYLADKLCVDEGNLRKCFLRIRRKAAEIIPILAS